MTYKALHPGLSSKEKVSFFKHVHLENTLCDGVSEQFQSSRTFSVFPGQRSAQDLQKLGNFLTINLKMCLRALYFTAAFEDGRLKRACVLLSFRLFTIRMQFQAVHEAQGCF